jgi:ubiquitin thioesterase protein OTUB1
VVTAIGFGYFETLIASGDQSQVEAEITRINDYTDLIVSVGGFNPVIFEDFVEETIDLLKEISDNISNRDACMTCLLEKFNDRVSSNAIIYHLRLLASTWLKANASLYEPFIPDGLGISGYCASYIERLDREIEHLVITLLASVLLEPVNFVLEIAYLDRSPGTQVNVYRFPESANGRDSSVLGPIIYLLYRPDHYDILYRSSPVAATSIQVNRVASFTHQHDITSHQPSLHSFSTVDFSPLAMIPGFSASPPGLSPLASPTATAPIPDAFASSPQSPWLSQPFPNPLQGAAPNPTPSAPSQAQSLSAQQPAAGSPGDSPTTTYPLRFSTKFYEHQYQLDNATFQAEPTFTTNMFKNSHFNKAHYNNPDFHPEEWTPDDDVVEFKAPSGKKKVRGKSE